MLRTYAVTALALLFAACGGPGPDSGRTLDAIAIEYLVLELSADRHMPGHVDAYFGPEALREEAARADLSPADILTQARILEDELDRRLAAPPGENDSARIEGLLARLLAMSTRIEMSEGLILSFEEEALRLFGASAPEVDEESFDAVLSRIDALLPGEGPIAERVEAFRSRFTIPADRLQAVFDAAIDECRRRTLKNIELPANESFSVDYVNDKPWSGYNWFQGGARSLIQINTDLPIFISRAVDLGCHEGYPGHHTYNSLLEEHLVYARGWIEFSLYPLFSPQSLIAEGSGNYGIDVAFPGDERVVFEKELLFPLAGLDAAEADRYYELLDMLAELDYAVNEAARDYLNGDIDREAAIDWLVDYTLVSEARARQRMDFIDTYRSYVINYNLGRDKVADWVERNSGSESERWQTFEELLSTPALPEDLEP